MTGALPASPYRPTASGQKVYDFDGQARPPHPRRSSAQLLDRGPRLCSVEEYARPCWESRARSTHKLAQALGTRPCLFGWLPFGRHAEENLTTSSQGNDGRNRSEEPRSRWEGAATASAVPTPLLASELGNLSTAPPPSTPEPSGAAARPMSRTADAASAEYPTVPGFEILSR